MAKSQRPVGMDKLSSSERRDLHTSCQTIVELTNGFSLLNQGEVVVSSTLLE